MSPFGDVKDWVRRMIARVCGRTLVNGTERERETVRRRLVIINLARALALEAEDPDLLEEINQRERDLGFEAEEFAAMLSQKISSEDSSANV